MATLLHVSFGDRSLWANELRNNLPDEEVREWPHVGDRADIEFVVTWDLPTQEYATFPNLRAILLLGAGISHLRPVESLPDVPIVRLVDDVQARDMAAYVLHWVIHFQRQMHRYAAHQRQARWQPEPYRATENHVVGILGFGTIGHQVAEVALSMGYPVRGWSRSPKTHDRVRTFAGADQLDTFLSGVHCLVNILPLTDHTRRVLDAERLAALPQGASIVNVGRGGTIDDDALLAALDRGHLTGAALDVFRGEPLGAESPFWSHPSVVVTPHVSGEAQPRSATRCVAANIARIRAGEAPFPVVDRARGY